LLTFAIRGWRRREFARGSLLLPEIGDFDVLFPADLVKDDQAGALAC
jgi:hypothetical protein